MASLISAENLSILWLTAKLAALVTLLLLLIAMPLAWWLANTRARIKPAVEAIVALPIVLPPTVLGFYLLVVMGPHGPVGQFTEALGLGALPFSFAGLVVASLFYSLPFVVQPIQNAFGAVDRRLLEAAAAAGSGPRLRFFTIALPLARPGFVTAAMLGFTHTVGEFGVALMVGGNIPGETRVVSVQIYGYVETLDYAQAHELAIVLMAFSFVTLFILYAGNRRVTPLNT
ncbi:MAG: molybdate ABC transporter permease subunit [Betaproteobacteria bacterium]|nr:molybdate ABC transporter permease subunit [Betaproteobacteria bacterium]